MSPLLSQGERGCEMEPKALTSGVFTPAAAKRWGWQLLLLLQRGPPDHSPPQTLLTPLHIPNLTASLVATTVIERKKQTVLEQLVSSCPRETICYPPLYFLHIPKAPSCFQTLTDSWECQTWCKQVHKHARKRNRGVSSITKKRF